MNKKTLAYAVGFIATILLANWLTTNYGFVPVGFGLTATAGTFAAGFALAFRDSIQEAGGKKAVLALVVIGGLLSYLVSDVNIAIASGVAFLVSELIDFAVYTPLRKKGFAVAVVGSNIVGSIFDTVIFLAIAGFPIWVAVPGQLVGKLEATLVFLVVIYAVKVLRPKA